MCQCIRFDVKMCLYRVYFFTLARYLHILEKKGNYELSVCSHLQGVPVSKGLEK